SGQGVRAGWIPVCAIHPPWNWRYSHRSQVEVRLRITQPASWAGCCFGAVTRPDQAYVYAFQVVSTHPDLRSLAQEAVAHAPASPHGVGRHLKRALGAKPAVRAARGGVRLAGLAVGSGGVQLCTAGDLRVVLRGGRQVV